LPVASSLVDMMASIKQSSW